MKKNYGLHDCKISKIEYKESAFEFYFDSGVYLLDNIGKETNLTSKCKMVLTLEDYIDREDQVLYIVKMRKNRYKELSFSKLCEMLNKNALDIENDFYSDFDNAILFKGYIDRYGIELTITDIKQTDFIFI